MTVLDSAPEGFDFDADALAGVAADALRKAAPDLFERLDAGELRYFAELDADRVPLVVVTDADGVEQGRLRLDWRRVARKEG